MLVALPEEHQIQQCNVEKQTKGRLVHRCKLEGSGAKTIKPGLRIAACVHCKTLFILEKLIRCASGTKGVRSKGTETMSSTMTMPSTMTLGSCLPEPPHRLPASAPIWRATEFVELGSSIEYIYIYIHTYNDI